MQTSLMPRAGFEIGMKGDYFVWCGLIFNWEHWRGQVPLGARPFFGKLRLQGDIISMNAKTAEREVIAAFGPPIDRDADPDDIVLSYLRDCHRYEIELTGQGTLASIAAFSPQISQR